MTGAVVEVFSSDVGEGASRDEKKEGSGGEESGESSDENEAQNSEKSAGESTTDSEGELTSKESESANKKEIKGETDADLPEGGSDENSAEGNGKERQCRDKEDGRGIDDGVERNQGPHDGWNVGREAS